LLTPILYDIYLNFFINIIIIIFTRLNTLLPLSKPIIPENFLIIYNHIMFYYTKNLLYLYPDSEFAKLNITLKKMDKKHKII